MTLPDKQTFLSAALGLALAVAPTTPVVAQDAPSKQQVDDLRRELETLKADLRKFQKDTETDLHGGAGSDGVAKVEGLIKRVRAIEDAFRSLQTDVKVLTTRLNELASKTTVGSSPLSGGNNPPAGMSPPPAAALRATIRLVNEYATPVSLILNGTSYQLKPGEVRSVSVPAGSYTYELLTAGAQPVTATIEDGKAVTLRIR